MFKKLIYLYKNYDKLIKEASNINKLYIHIEDEYRLDETYSYLSRVDELKKSIDKLIDNSVKMIFSDVSMDYMIDAKRGYLLELINYCIKYSNPFYHFEYISMNDNINTFVIYSILPAMQMDNILEYMNYDDIKYHIVYDKTYNRYCIKVSIDNSILYDRLLVLVNTINMAIFKYIKELKNNNEISILMEEVYIDRLTKYDNTFDNISRFMNKDDINHYDNIIGILDKNSQMINELLSQVFSN